MILPLDSRKYLKLQSLIHVCAVPRQGNCLWLLPFLSTASEDEEIMIQFWNDKKVKLQRGVALWIPPSLWERIVEMIHMPFTSRAKPRESPDANSCTFSCSPNTALIPVCAVHSLAKHCVLCSPCWPLFHYHCDGICCSSAYVRCICCCHPHVDAWWPLPSRSLVFQRETEEVESSSKPSPHLLELEGPNQEQPAVVAASSPSSDSEWDLEPFPAKSTVVDSAVNTESVCLEKSRLKDSARPEGKYWKRSHHRSHPSSSGTFQPPSQGRSSQREITKCVLCPLRLGSDFASIAVYYKFAYQPWIQYFPLPNISAASPCVLAFLLATHPMENYWDNESHLEPQICLSEFLPHHFPVLFMMLTSSLTFIASPCRINRLKQFLSGLKHICLSSEMNVSPFQF